MAGLAGLAGLAGWPGWPGWPAGLAGLARLAVAGFFGAKSIVFCSVLTHQVNILMRKLTFLDFSMVRLTNRENTAISS